jgi:hypothetical protein
MTRALALGALAAALASVTFQAQTAPQPRRAVVRVSATRDADVAPVTTMTPAALDVFVDGAPARVDALVLDRDPLSLVLLVDATKTMSEVMVSFVWDPSFTWNGQRDVASPNPPGSRAPDSPRALFLDPIRLGLLRRLRAGDRVSIATISKARDPGSPFTSDRRAILRDLGRALAVPSRDRHGPSPIWDATDAAVARLESEPGRRVVVLISDGLSTGNRLGLDAVIDRAARSGVAVFVVAEASGPPRSGRGWTLGDSTHATWTMVSSPFGSSPLGNLARLADGTGGVAAIDGLRSTPDPQRRIDAIVRVIRDSYVMTIAMPEDRPLTDRARALDVRSRTAAVSVHAPRWLP